MLNTFLTITITLSLVMIGFVLLMHAFAYRFVSGGIKPSKTSVTILSSIGSSLLVLGLIGILSEALFDSSDITYEVVGEYEIAEIGEIPNSYVVKYVQSREPDKDTGSIIHKETNQSGGNYSLTYIDSEYNKDLEILRGNVIEILLHENINPRIVISKADNYNNKYFWLFKIAVPKDKQNKYEIYLPE